MTTAISAGDEEPRATVTSTSLPAIDADLEACRAGAAGAARLAAWIMVGHVTEASRHGLPDGAAPCRCRRPRLGSRMSSAASPPDSPAERVSTPVDGVDVLGALSPSRAGDFMTCPLLYRFRTIDRLPEAPSPDARARHRWCTRCSRTSSTCRPPSARPSRPRDMLVPAWDALLEAEPELAEMFARARAPERRRAGSPRAAPCSTATSPSRTRAASSRPSASSTSRRCSTPSCCCAASSTGSTWRPTGAIRVVDYKTGRSPGRDVRGQGAVPDEVLRAGHLAHPRRRPGDAAAGLPRQRRDRCATSPTRPTCCATERKVEAIWRAIRRAEETGDWRPSPSRLCDWCSFQALCPT